MDTNALKKSGATGSVIEDSDWQHQEDEDVYVYAASDDKQQSKSVVPGHPACSTGFHRSRQTMQLDDYIYSSAELNQ